MFGQHPRDVEPGQPPMRALGIGKRRAQIVEQIVMGFDDAPVSAWASHGLTTVAQSLEALTAATLEAIDRAPEAPPLHLRLPVALVERSSVALAAHRHDVIVP